MLLLLWVGGPEDSVSRIGAPMSPSVVPLGGGALLPPPRGRTLLLVAVKCLVLLMLLTRPQPFPRVSDQARTPESSGTPACLKGRGSDDVITEGRRAR